LYPKDTARFNALEVLAAFRGDEGVGGMLKRVGGREVGGLSVARLVKEVGLVKSNSIGPTDPH
jgi:hypothetical protein